MKQHSNNVLDYHGEHSPVVKIKDELLKLADSLGEANCGHGTFNIQQYQIISETPSRLLSEDLFPVKTLNLRKIESVKGTGVYQIEKLF